MWEGRDVISCRAGEGRKECGGCGVLLAIGIGREMGWLVALS